MILLTAQVFTPNLDGLIPAAIGLMVMGYIAWQIFKFIMSFWRKPPTEGTNLGE